MSPELRAQSTYSLGGASRGLSFLGVSFLDFGLQGVVEGSV